MRTVRERPADEVLPQLSLAERDRRWGLVRREMALHGIEALLVWGNDRSFGCASANLRYLTQISTHGGVAIFPNAGDPIVFAGSTHTSVPMSSFRYVQDWVEDVRPYTGMRPVTAALEEMGLGSARLGIVGHSLVGRDIITYQEYQALTAALPRAQVVNVTGILDGARLRKSPEEIGMIRRAAGVARAMLDVLEDEARPGARECDVFADMVREQLRLGGEAFVFLALSSGRPGGSRPLIHAQGVPYAPSGRFMQEGDLIITEFHGSYGGYLAAVEASFFLGTPPRELVELYDVAGRVLKSGLEKFRPGVPLKAVWEAMRRPVEEAGMAYVECGFHGHGLASPEFPSVIHPPHMGGRTGRGLEMVPLEENMVFGLNIDLHNPTWRTDTGIMFADTILVTRDGPEVLVGVEPRLTPRAA